MALRISQLHHNSTLNIYHPSEGFRANKIICTIGPSTQSVAALKKLMTEGMNVVRMNFSHGDYDFHQKTIDNTRIAAKELGLHVGIALDTKGPEIRTGLFPGGEVMLDLGHAVSISTKEEWRAKGNKDCFFIEYPHLADVMSPGDSIYIDDGLLALQVKSTDPAEGLVHCEVIVPSTISSNKGCNLPGKKIDLPAVSEKDKADLAFAAAQGVDFVFASFIRTAEQVREVRALLGGVEGGIQVISKIENHEGVQNLDEILAASDGIMVARGDLGVELAPEKVFVAQKCILSKCNIAGKPGICATQMLESMTKNPRPTRAEVSDVANAVLDGADCVMLSGETAKGKYPDIVVNVMARICREAQSVHCGGDVFHSIKQMQSIPMPIDESVCSSSVNSAFELEARAIVVLTNSGKTARLLAKYHPKCPIICCSTSEKVCRHLSIVRSVFPVFYSKQERGEDPDKTRRVQVLLEFGKKEGLIKVGDVVLVVHADLQIKGYANQTRVIRVP